MFLIIRDEKINSPPPFAMPIPRLGSNTWLSSIPRLGSNTWLSSIQILDTVGQNTVVGINDETNKWPHKIVQIYVFYKEKH